MLFKLTGDNNKWPYLNEYFTKVISWSSAYHNIFYLEPKLN